MGRGAAVARGTAGCSRRAPPMAILACACRAEPLAPTASQLVRYPRLAARSRRRVGSDTACAHRGPVGADAAGPGRGSRLLRIHGGRSSQSPPETLGRRAAPRPDAGAHRRAATGPSACTRAIRHGRSHECAARMAFHHPRNVAGCTASRRPSRDAMGLAPSGHPIDHRHGAVGSARSTFSDGLSRTDPGPGSRSGRGSRLAIWHRTAGERIHAGCPLIGWGPRTASGHASHCTHHCAQIWDPVQAKPRSPRPGEKRPHRQYLSGRDARAIRSQSSAGIGRLQCRPQPSRTLAQNHPCEPGRHLDRIDSTSRNTQLRAERIGLRLHLR